MTTLSARIIADSTSPGGARLTTFQLRYPRWIHAELLTHRAFARNSSSSRAIPVQRMNAMIHADPALPLHLGLDQPGMQAHREVTSHRERRIVYALWKTAMRAALRSTEDMVELCGISKQVANRLTEAHQHIGVVLSATDWGNFFAQRCHSDAEPHFRALAWLMADEWYVGSTPTPRAMGEWHLPYIQDEERGSLDIDTQLKCSTARCARVSYANHDGSKVSVEKDAVLYERLMAGLLSDDAMEPGHLSPLEHQATPLEDPGAYSGPFRGWEQHRKRIPHERMEFNYEEAKARGWRDEALAILDQEFPPLT